MQRVRLRWYGPFDLDDAYDPEFKEYDDCYIYMFLSNSEIIYVGAAYYQGISRRIKQHLSGDSTWEWVVENYNPDDISIRVAEVELIDQKRISKRLVDDIEALIIGLLQPPGNIQSMKIYHGRDLRISNVGDRGLLPKTLSTNQLD